MRRFLVLALVSALVAGPMPLAQAVEIPFPDPPPDLSGLWLPTSQESTRRILPDAYRFNIVTQAGGPEIVLADRPDDFRVPSFRFAHTGALWIPRVWTGTYRDPTLGNISTACAVDELRYDLDGYVEWTGDERLRVQLIGTSATPELGFSEKVSLVASSAFGQAVSIADPSAIDYVMQPIGDDVPPGPTPSTCADLLDVSPQYGHTFHTRLTNTRKLGNATGTVTGVVVDAMSGGGVTGLTIDLRQETGPNEEIVIAQADLAPDGRFRFEGVPVWKPANGPAGGEVYDLVVSGGVAVVRGVDTGIYSEVTVEDVGPFSTTTVKVERAEAFDRKLELIEVLTKLAPNGYGSVEGRVREWLGQTASDGPDERDLEAVRRSVWVERAVADITRDAHDWIDRGMGNLATFVTNVYKDLVDGSSEAIRDSKKLVETSQKLSPGLRSAVVRARGDATTNVPLYFARHHARTNANAALGQVGKIVGAVGSSLGHVLLLAGWEKDDAAALVKALQTVIGEAVTTAQTQTIAGASRGILTGLLAILLKTEVAKVLFDSSFGFSGQASKALDFSYEAMRRETWDASDDSYRFSRNQLVQTLGGYRERSAEMYEWYLYSEAVLQSATATQAITDALGAFGKLAERIPVVKALSVTLKGLKYGANVTNIVLPATVVLDQSLRAVQATTCLGWGQIPARTTLAGATDWQDICSNRVPGPNPEGATNPTSVRGDGAAGSDRPEGFTTFAATGVADSLRRDLDLRRGAVRSVLQTVRTALADDDLATILDVMSTYDEDGWIGTRDALSSLLDVIEVARAGTPPDTDMASRHVQDTLVGQRRAAVAQAFADLDADVEALVLAVATAQVTSGHDARLRAMTALAVRSADNAIEALDALAFRAAELTTPVPLVSATAKPPVSTTTGERLVTRAGERFTLSATVRNHTAEAITPMQVRLDIPAGTDLTVEGSPQITVPALAAHDGALGGGDEFEVTWILRHGGDDRAPVVPLAVTLLGQDGERPQDRLTADGVAVLALDTNLADADLDGLPDWWEREHGLALGTDDRAADPDGDGLSNGAEWSRRTDPRKSDTDGDGLADGRETMSDPTLADTDGDGTTDATDRAPRQPATTAATTATGEPAVTTSTDAVVLTPEKPYAVIDISDATGADLRWMAWADEGYVKLAVDADAPRGPGPMLVTIAPGFEFGKSTFSTTVHVIDVSGQVADEVAVEVVLARDAQAAADAKAVRRLSGSDREATALEISRAQFPEGTTASNIVLARSDDFADGLAGTPLAFTINAPLLLTPTGSISEAVLAEAERVSTGQERPRIYLLGGTKAISRDVERALDARGFNTVRISGPNRYATAVAIARKRAEFVGARQALPLERVLLTRGDNFPDALAAGPAASLFNGVILLTEGDRPHPDTVAYLASLGDEIETHAVGGPAARAHPQADRLAGSGREETALAVARAFFGAAPNNVSIARSDRFADALSGGVHASVNVGPVLLTSSTSLHPAVAAYLREVADGLSNATVYGGRSAISDDVAAQVAAHTGLHGER